ncbi:hypothetical protein F5Y19DRAFT_17847 [Xylariaceae sp. FL1651]|nr:hypothetical protein F5Y19DRAFT_17847 [Xylariaceae sp. FL1651]
MATTSSLGAAQPIGRDALDRAVDEFRSILDDSQRRELDKLQPVPDADAILVFTAKLDSTNRNRRGRSFASRLHTVLLAVQNFCSIADTFVSARPEIAAFVWGSVKLTMMVISNYTSYYEATSDLFMRIGRLCPLFNEYLVLYRSSTRLRQSLLGFHASIVYCCRHVLAAIQRTWREQVFQAFKASFEQEFKSDIDDIKRCSNSVKEEIALAQAQADLQEQRLQALEREKASTNRLTVRKFISRANNSLDDVREWQVQSSMRKTQKRIQKLLNALSTYNHLRLLKYTCLQRHRNTLCWIFQTSEFHRWVDGAVPLLCCFGKIGSGKTFATASVVDYILAEKGSDCGVSFFFVESANQESLDANTIIRSILRQRLDPTQIPQEVVNGLERLDSFSELDEFVKLLRIMMPPPRIFYIVIDGLDECEKLDRSRLLAALSSLAVLGENIRLFLSGRDSLRAEIQKRFSAFDSLSMDCASAHDDVSVFIRDIVREKVQNNEISIGDPCLEEDIKQALFHGAQGMFLWVTFQVHEICLQHCDEDIRNTLKDLPRTLSETYCRVLRRIKSRGHGKEVQKMFPWIAASRQLLSLSQLREAIAIEPGQQYSKPERLYNDMENIAAWCENLVRVDEEYQLVQFAHSTIRKFITEEPLDSTLVEFHVDLKEVDHEIGEKCVTYLNFNDFKTTVTRRPRPILLQDTTQIAQSALGYQSKPALILAKLHPKRASKPVDLSSFRSLTIKDSSTTYERLALGYPFLEYAVNNWLLHTRNFHQERSKTWSVWENMVVHGHNLAKPPWGASDFNVNGPILKWACDTHHYALIRLIVSSDILDKDLRYQIILDLVKYDDVNVLDIILEGQDSKSSLNWALQNAAIKADLKAVVKLLAAGADVNATAANNSGWTALQGAAYKGDFKIVERLLAAGADVNAPGRDGFTALQEAAKWGSLKLVERLLAVGADVNATAAEYSGWAALQGAAYRGDLKIVERLLAVGADVNAPAARESGFTALQAAALKGDVKVVERLLAAGADVNAPGRDGFTALQTAKRKGNDAVILCLKKAGARKQV